MAYLVTALGQFSFQTIRIGPPDILVSPWRQHIMALNLLDCTWWNNIYIDDIYRLTWLATSTRTGSASKEWGLLCFWNISGILTPDPTEGFSWRTRGRTEYRNQEAGGSQLDPRVFILAEFLMKAPSVLLMLCSSERSVSMWTSMDYWGSEIICWENLASC